MKAVIVGAGFAAESHAAALRANGIDIAAVIAQHEESAKAFAQRHGIPKFGTDLRIACDETVDAVHLCTPPTMHGAQVRQLLMAGKHVLCEKPLSVDAEEATELAALAERQQLVTAVTFNVRYHMAVQRAREIVQSGVLGRPLLIHGSYLQEFHALPAPYGWRYDETKAGPMRAVTEIGTHWFDAAEYVSGEKIERVSANFGNFHPERRMKDGLMYAKDACPEGERIDVWSEDAAVISLRFESGALGSVVLSEVSEGRGNRLSLEVTCEKGNLWWNEEENNELNVAIRGEGLKREIFAFGNGFDDTFRELIRRFYAEIAAIERQDIPTFAEGARIAKICDAAARSAARNAAWEYV